MVTRVDELKNRAVAAFWRLADKRIPKEWMLLILGGLALLLYVFVLFFGTRPRK
jgi:hypothetical protein